MSDNLVNADSFTHLRVKGTKDALEVRFVASKLVAMDMLQAVGVELISVAKLASRIDMPLVVSFQGVSIISSALIGKLVLLNKLAKRGGTSLRFCDMAPAVHEVIRRTIGGDGAAGSMAIL